MLVFKDLKKSADVISADAVKIINALRHDIDFYGCFGDRRYNDCTIRCYDEPDFTLESDVEKLLNVNSGCRVLFSSKRTEDANKFDLLELDDYESSDIVIVSRHYAQELNKSISGNRLKLDEDILDRLYVLVKVSDNYGNEGFKDVTKVFAPQKPQYYIEKILSGKTPSLMSIMRCIEYYTTNDDSIDRELEHLLLLADGYYNKRCRNYENN